MDILSQVIAATESKLAGTVEVVSENHDVSKVNVGSAPAGELPSAGLRRQIETLKGGGFWDANEYGISRENQIAALEVSYAKALVYEASPEGIAKAQAEAERVLSDMRARAIRRASLDVSSGKVSVFVAGEPAWHGLGVNVKDAVTSADAIRLANLDWRVTKVPMGFCNPVKGGAFEVSEDDFAIVRMDTGTRLGTVGSRYEPFQNAEGFEFLDSVLGSFGARYESAGAIYGGSKVWMLVRLPGAEFSVNGADRVEAFAIFTNTHDGSGSAKCFPTSQRVVCANTFRLAQSDADKGLSIRHTGNLKQKVESAKKALGLTVERFAEFKTASEELTRVKVDPVVVFDSVLDAVLDITAADAAKGADVLAASLKMTDAERKVEESRLSRVIEKRGGLLEDLLARYESEKNGMGGMRGTAWAAFNAVTESADHGPLGGRYNGTADDRKGKKFESVVAGGADEVKQIAWETVLGTVKA